MSLAYKHETDAPPFGIFIDETARTFGEEPFRTIWFSWNDPKYIHDNIKNIFLEKMSKYFTYVLQHPHILNYEIERIEYHQKLFKELFPEYIMATTSKESYSNCSHSNNKSSHNQSNK